MQSTASLLREAFAQIRHLRAQLAERTAPIAIIGAGCRFPGGVDDLESFARVLRAGTDAVGRVPADRWDADAFYDADPDAPGKMHSREAACLPTIDQFDADFFGITRREAEHLDPQQRLLLEVAWSALEDASIPPDRIRGSRTGVFTGLMYGDYVVRALRENGLEGIGAYLGTGGTFSATAGRLAYVLGLQGPTMAVDTACSSSLVSVHLACQALRQGECDLALAGGVNALLTPEPSINLTKARMISPGGRCRTFDASADGYVRGEGCGLVVLKPLARALADGDRVLGVIRGSAVNQDGRSSGLTAPNRIAQQKLLEAALAAAGVASGDIGYVECHGTATPLGDPIEVSALREVLGRDRPADRPLALGSVKTNFGHLEGAAGICGLLKALLVVRGAEVFPHLHLQTLNPRIKLDDTMRIPTRGGPWFTSGGPRLAGVSSFGFVGTNAHVIVEAPTVAPVPEARGGPEVLTLSATTAPALAQLVERQCAWLEAHPEVDLTSMARTLNDGRMHHPHRWAIVAEDRFQVLAALRSPAQAGFRGEVQLNRPPQVAFLFTGQGSQYLGMGQVLAAKEPVFRQALERCADILRPLLSRPLLELMWTAPAAELEATGAAQPALFALEYSLLELWASWGVKPDLLLGHSVGEYVAACAAGIFEVEDALKLVAARGRLMQALPANGGMAAVFADETAVRAALVGYEGRVEIAACNGPQETVISGDRVALATLLETLAATGISGRALAVSHAFHSRLMRPMLAEFSEVLASVTFQTPQLPIVATLTGAVDTAHFMARPDYWLEQIVAPVRFAEGIAAVETAGVQFGIELGPRAILSGLAKAGAIKPAMAWMPSLEGPRDDGTALARAVAAIHVAGGAVNWTAFHQERGGSRIGLPTYPFQRQRYWLPAVAAVTEAVGVRPDQFRPAPAGAVAFSVMFFAATPNPLDRDKYRLVLEAARFADRHGFDSVWVPERHFTEMGGLYPNPAVLQAALARETRRVQLRAGSVVAALHHPVRIAEEWSMVDNLSGGRVGISLAAGWNPDDFSFFPERYAERHGKLAETLATVRSLWRGEELELVNGVGKPTRVRLRPAPLQRDLPVWLTAAGNPRTFEKAGELGANLLTHLLDQDLEDLAKKIAMYRAARAAHGHAPATGRVTVMVHTFIGEDLATTRERVRGPFCAYLKASRNLLAGLAQSRGRSIDVAALSERDLDELVAFLFERFSTTRALIGTVETCAPLVAALHAAGVDEIACLLDFGQSTADVLGGLPSLDALQRHCARELPATVARSRALPSLAEPVVPTDDLYDILWRLQPVHPATAAPMITAKERWLILGDHDGMGEALAAALGHSACTLISSERLGVEVDWADVFRVFSAGGDAGLRVIWLGPIAASNDEAGLWIERARQLVQALVTHCPKARLSTITRGAVAVGGSLPALGQSALWGFLRVLAQEHATLWGGLYDLEPGSDTVSAAGLLAGELPGVLGEDKVAWRGSQRWVERMVRLPVASGLLPAPWSVRSDIAYLITGGLGGVGLAVADWLTSRGARHLVLQGRSVPGAAAQGVVDSLRKQGVTVEIWSVDVADEAALRRAIEARRERGDPGIRGVMHAAGVWRDLPLVQLGSEDLATVLAPKLAGTLALERCLGAELDCFVSFSSLSAVLSAHGQANYAAANAFLDAHAQWRRAQGRPALSINWGPWSGVGFGASDHGRKAHERLESFGLRRIAPGPALAALGELLARGATQAAVVTIDWPLLARVDEPLARTPFLAEVAGPLVREKGAPEPMGDVAREIASAPMAEQPARLGGAVAAIVARVFRITPAELRLAEPLSNLGLDSLMAVEIKNRIRADLGADVPLALFLEGASTNVIADCTTAEWMRGAAAPAALTEEFTV